MNKNEALGDKKMKAGKENVTTGIFQWSKDYASGATNFSEARRCSYTKLNTLKQLGRTRRP